MDILLISDQPLTVIALRSVLSGHDQVAGVIDAACMAEAMTLLTGPHQFGMIVLDLDTHGVRAVITRAAQTTGRDRQAEALEQRGLAADAGVVNVQGHEPLIAPARFDPCAATHAAHPHSCLIKTNDAAHEEL